MVAFGESLRHGEWQGLAELRVGEKKLAETQEGSGDEVAETKRWDEEQRNRGGSGNASFAL
jgi:hypothetical protein